MYKISLLYGRRCWTSESCAKFICKSELEKNDVQSYTTCRKYIKRCISSVISKSVSTVCWRELQVARFQCPLILQTLRFDSVSCQGFSWNLRVLLWEYKFVMMSELIKCYDVFLYVDFSCESCVFFFTDESGWKKSSQCLQACI